MVGCLMYKEVKPDGTTVLTTGISMADIQAAIDAAVLAARLAENPVGKIRFSANNVNPGTYLTGTTWVAWGSGRVPTGVDTGQTEFDTAEETGGSKTHTLTTAQLPSHTHAIDHDHGSFTSGSSAVDAAFSLTDTASNPDSASAIDRGSGGDALTRPISGSSHTHSVDVPAFSGNSGSAGSGNSMPILQPYITCYMWKRTA